jgi:MFS transporter, OFA family, oxalate/formate antiporter
LWRDKVRDNGSAAMPNTKTCATLTDTFGPKFAATNYGFLYIAQGVGSIFGGPAAAFLKEQTGSWTTVFILVACLDALTALLAITLLKRMRRRHFKATH